MRVVQYKRAAVQYRRGAGIQAKIHCKMRISPRSVVRTVNLETGNRLYISVPKKNNVRIADVMFCLTELKEI